jgi:UDP-3-O-[3-hydroxymyristoyl] N-acetylglucosamine deacetylase
MFKKTGTRQGWTLASSITFEGMAVMSGSNSCVRVHPRKESGFSIRRAHEQGTFFNENNVVDASQRMTQIGWGSDRVMLVEHLMSALFGVGFDSAELEIEGIEVPIFDGSSLVFAEKLSKIEKIPAALIDVYELVDPISHECGDSHYLLTPLEGKFKWQCVIDYPNTPAIGLQRFDFDSQTTDYFKEVSAARTFCLEHEAEMMKAKGLIRSATLDNGLVFGANGPLNPKGLRYENEPARHKLLDLLGDLALLGVDLHFQGVALKPGHKGNNSLAKIIREKLVS